MLIQALGDLVESCMGAILLDTGFDLNHAWKIMLSILDSIMNFSDLQLNPIRELQELCQHHNWDLQFPTLKQGGTFLVEAKVSWKDNCTSASAKNANRKDARKIASHLLFTKLKVNSINQLFLFRFAIAIALCKTICLLSHCLLEVAKMVYLSVMLVVIFAV